MLLVYSSQGKGALLFSGTLLLPAVKMVAWISLWVMTTKLLLILSVHGASNIQMM